MCVQMPTSGRLEVYKAYGDLEAEDGTSRHVCCTITQRSLILGPFGIFPERAQGLDYPSFPLRLLACVSTMRVLACVSTTTVGQPKQTAGPSEKRHAAPQTNTSIMSRDTDSRVTTRSRCMKWLRTAPDGFGKHTCGVGSIGHRQKTFLVLLLIALSPTVIFTETRIANETPLETVDQRI